MTKKSLDWAEKYRPSTLGEVAGNDSAVKKLVEWARTWEEHRRPALLVGPPGVGKTSAAHALANDMDWEVMEMNASDQRTASMIQEVAGEAALTGTFSGTTGRRVIILDEADNLHGNKDRGGARAISDLAGRARQPIILIVNDLYGLSRGLRDRCENIHFRALREASVLKVLKRICWEEGLNCEPESLSVIASVNRELRGAINDLQAAAAGRNVLKKEDVAPSFRDTKENIFEVMKLIFQGKNPKDALQATYDLDESPEDIVQWVDENLPRARGGEALARSYYYLSRADIFLGRTRNRQSYRLWRYASFLMTSGVNVAGDNQSSGYLRYQVPQHWMLLGRTRGQRSIRDNVARRASTRYHCSPRKFLSDILPYFRMFLADEQLAVATCARLELDQDEVAFLLGVKKDSARAKKIHASAESLAQYETGERIAESGCFGITRKFAKYDEQKEEDGGSTSDDPGLERSELDVHGEPSNDEEVPKDQRTLFEFK